LQIDGVSGKPHLASMSDIQPTYILALIALLAGLARGFSGFGAALIFMPLASAILGPKLAAAVLMVTDIVFGLPLGLRALRQVKPIGTGLMLLGAFVLAHIDPLILRWIIAGLVVSMLAVLTSGWRYSGEAKGWLIVLVGAISGLFSGIAQIGGPPVVAYYLGRRGAAATDIRASIFLFFAGSSVIGLLTYLYGGLITRDALKLALITGPAYGLGIFGGSHMFGLASETTFRRVVLMLIAAGVVVSLPVWH
jgi:uncharacterized protein